MAKCNYYNKDQISIPDRQKRPTLNQLPPIQFTRIWCGHENPALRKDEKGELECNGEIGKDSRCPLSSN